MKLLTLILATIAPAAAALGQQATTNSIQFGTNYIRSFTMEHPKWVCVTNETVTREGPLRYSKIESPDIMRTEIRESVTTDVSSNLVLRVWYSGQWKEMVLDSTPILQRTHREYSIEYQRAEIKTLMYSNSVPVFQSVTNFQPQ